MKFLLPFLFACSLGVKKFRFPPRQVRVRSCYVNGWKVQVRRWWWPFWSYWCLVAMCGAAEVRLAWDEQPDAAGFKIYYGSASRTYFNCQDVGCTNQTTIKNPGSGKTYYFAATATNSAGESAFSNEISWNDSIAQITNNSAITLILERATNILGPWSGVMTNKFTNSVSGTRFFRSRLEHKLITR